MLLDPDGQARGSARQGRLIYVAGPSGAGKDTLLQFVRERIPARAPFIFAHRYITRQARGAGDEHVTLTPAEFNLRMHAGFFAMHWRANGNAYGVGVEIDRWLLHGFHVIVNGSRGYLPHARRAYPALRLVWIGASPHLLNARLSCRARETAPEIAQRIERAAALPLPAYPPDLTLQNDNAPDEAGGQLLDFLLNELSSERSEAEDIALG